MVLDTECRHDIDPERPPLATVTSAEPVSLSSMLDSAPFRITGLDDGTYFVQAWMDSAGRGDRDTDRPSAGDLASGRGLQPRCREVTVVDGDAPPVSIELDRELAFDLPESSATEAQAPGAAPSVDPATIVDDGSLSTLTVELIRTAEPDQGGDGRGAFISGLSADCFDLPLGGPDDLDALDRPLVLPEDVRMPAQDTPVVLKMADLPNGVYQFSGFLDDVAGPVGRPGPNVGDLMSFGPHGPACTEVVLTGEDVTITHELNLAVTEEIADAT